jgi:uncharacterized protein (DUF433 family)
MTVSLVVGSVGGGMTVDEVMHEYRLTRFPRSCHL